jgi:predicted nucleic acid-binding protein
MPEGARRNFLNRWLEKELPMRFEGRLIGVDATDADLWGRLLAKRQTAGRPINLMDACIGAIARRHKLMLVTRNTVDFELLGITVINPWHTARR